MKISIIIYSNPDELPPTINAIQLLSKEFDIIVIARNQNPPQITYPNNVIIYRLGKLKTARKKEAQSTFMKIFEYIGFILKATSLVWLHKCKFIYAYDAHGFVAGFIAARIMKKIPIVYHNHDFSPLCKTKGMLSYWVKRLEYKFAHYAQNIVFSQPRRAEIFKNETKLKSMPNIIINTPIVQKKLPQNYLLKSLEHYISHESKIILYLGVISKNRCIPEIIDSMRWWPKDSYFVLIGEYRGDFLIPKEDKRIILLPAVPYTECFNYIIGADVGIGLYKPIDINWRHIIGASNKLFQYIAMGIPFVTNDNKEAREFFPLFKQFFANPNSPESIGKAVCNALKFGKELKNELRNLHLTKYNYEIQFNPMMRYIKRVVKRCGY